MTSLDVARLYTGYGWSVIPVPHGSKNPGFDGWQNLRLTEADLPHRFNGKPQNVGVLLGEPSNGLVDVDLDCVQAIRLAPRFLPHTELRFGRSGKPDSHWLYLCDPLVPTERFMEVRDVVVEGKKKRPTLVEFRSTRSQTIFPWSTHESGEPITFCAEGVPTVVEGAVLAAHVAKLAAAALLARHWPGEGTRHYAAGALAGGLARAGWAQEDIVAFAEAGGDDQVDQRERLASDTFDNLPKGQHVTGWKRLIEIFGKDVVSRVTKWLGVASAHEPEGAFGGFAGSAGGGFLAGEWSDPQPLPVELPPVMPFHEDLLPRSLQIWISDIAERVQCPPDFPAIAAVVGLAAVVRRKVGIRPKRREDWLVVPNLWGKAIGRPGIMKTPACRSPSSP